MATNVSDSITLAGIDDAPGLRFRHFRGPTDYPGLTEANNASEAADGEEWVATVGEIAHILSLIHISEPTRPY